MKVLTQSIKVKNRQVGLIDKQKEKIVNSTILLSSCTEMIQQGKRLITITATDQRQEQGVFRLYYLFADEEQDDFLTLILDIDEKESAFPSITPLIPAANWSEREIQDLFGLQALGHPDPRRLILHEDWPDGMYPLRKDFDPQQPIPRVKGTFTFPKIQGTGITEVPVGPIHAGIIEPGHFRFQTLGEEVLQLDAKLFYTHRGIEKRLEGMDILEALVIIEQICGVCIASHSVSYTQAIEKLAGIQVSRHADYLRTIFLEMERLYNHIGDIGNICAGVGFAVGNSHGLRLKEELMRINKKIFGHRYLRGYNRIGGVSHGLSDSSKAELMERLTELEKDFRELIMLLKEHEIFMDRLTGTGRLVKKIALEWGAVGPAARASGVSRDVRIQYPYAAYKQHPIKLVMKSEGDVLARVDVRIEEVYQSFSFIKEVLAELPEGPIQSALPEQINSNWSFGLTESPKGENMHWVMIGENGKIERYHIRSATFSNWAVVPFTVPGNIIPDFPLINKSFELCYSCCDR